MTTTTEPAAQRPQHELLIDEFMELDKQCQEIIEKFNSGKILYDAVPTSGWASFGEFMQMMVEKWNAIREHLNSLLDKRNAKLQEASAALRGTVMAAETLVRGPDGKSTTNRYGPFEVSSKTYRSFNPTKLFEELQKLGLYERLLDLQQINDKSGAAEPAVRMSWSIAYDPVKNWLRESNLEPVLQSAYEEEEGTPAVTGPKPLAMLGEVDKSKKGKK